VCFSTSKDPEDPIETRVSAAQSQLMLRCLIGVLAEAWEYIKKNHKIVGSYVAVLDDEGRNSYTILKKQFGKSGLLHKLRNELLYHYPKAPQLEEAFEWISDNEEWEWYFSETNTNSFYFSCELAVGYAIMKATKEPLHMTAFGTVMAETMKIADTLPYFLMPLMRAILTKHLGPDILRPRAGTVVKNAPKIDEFWIPFFAEPMPPKSVGI
jgi:hypothetical protein